MTELSGQSFDRYRILVKLGEGGMATVYKAYDPLLEREVAVKIIRTEQLAPIVLERALKRFEHEAKALAKLTHTNIVPISDYGEHDGKPYLVMPYLPGGTLKDRLGKPMPWQEAARLLAPIARALEYAHQRKIIHRDVKPSNILITESGEPMLSDFGIAKMLEGEETTVDLTGTGGVIGTYEYMAPEQGLGEPVDQRADIYALGIVFYEMVTGRPPYRADTPMAVMLKKTTEPLPRPNQFVTNIPESIERILIKALAKEPENRYTDMAEMTAALEDLITGGSTIRKAAAALPVQKTRSAEETYATVDQEDTYATRLEEVTRAENPPITPTRQTEGKKGVMAWLPWAAGGGVAALCIIVGLTILLTMLIPEPEPPASTSIQSPSNSTGIESVPTSPPEQIPTLSPDPVLSSAPSSPTSSETYRPLSGCNASRLRVGNSAYVASGGSANAVRSEPNTSSNNNDFYTAMQGEVMEIVGGPECDQAGNGWIMWEVRTLYGDIGWTPEGNDSEFWLVPLIPWQACTNAPLSRLQKGDQAIVSMEITTPNHVREQPDTNSNILYHIAAGETIEIVDGPMCSGSMVWWKIRAASQSKDGWTSEGDYAGYYLVPVFTGQVSSSSSPRMTNFRACLESCTGQNSLLTFPEKTTLIYAQWQYQNIPLNAAYVRTWTYGGAEWGRYECTWPHSSSGIASLSLTEPGGLRSGDWTMTIYINGKLMLQETIHISGSWSYWDPAGYFDTCYGKR